MWCGPNYSIRERPSARPRPPVAFARIICEGWSHQLTNHRTLLACRRRGNILGEQLAWQTRPRQEQQQHCCRTRPPSGPLARRAAAAHSHSPLALVGALLLSRATIRTTRQLPRVQRGLELSTLTVSAHGLRLRHDRCAAGGGLIRAACAPAQHAKRVHTRMFCVTRPPDRMTHICPTPLSSPLPGMRAGRYIGNGGISYSTRLPRTPGSILAHLGADATRRRGARLEILPDPDTPTLLAHCPGRKQAGFCCCFFQTHHAHQDNSPNPNHASWRFGDVHSTGVHELLACTVSKRTL